MTKIVLPNVRKVFVPDPGFVMFEADLKGADAQVVAWRAEDADLKTAFRSGLDVHSKNAEDMLGAKFTSLPSGSHARDRIRQDNKKAVHLTNYGGSSRTLATSLGWTIADAERFQARWFSLHPSIRRWHDDVRQCLERNRTITNGFGFRRVFFDRIDQCFAEALAWEPQSTVALNTYYGALQLERQFWPEQLKPSWMPRTLLDLEGMLLQTHDSINFQFRADRAPLPQVLQGALAVVIPYPDPLTIQWEIKQTTRSWGEMEECKLVG